jgi:dTDP-4-dehydrorhamnose reductase
MKNLLILGASGLTGNKIFKLAKNKFNTFGSYNKRFISDSSLFKIDITDENDLRGLFKCIKPDIVINTAALVNVDQCETHSYDAYQINSKAVQLIAKLCNNFGSRLIHLSTDYVFDGEKGNYSEIDKPNPQSVYGKSKLKGEEAAKLSCSYSIVRTSVIYGWTQIETSRTTSSSGKSLNFVLWALNKMNKKEKLEIVIDQFSSPTFVDEIAITILKIATIENNEIYHVAGNSCINRYEFTKTLASIMGYPSSEISPIKNNSINQIAKRPKNSCLNCTKIQRDLNMKLSTVEESLSILRKQIEQASPSLLGDL